MTIMGINPYKTYWTQKFLYVFTMLSMASAFIPSVAQFLKSLNDNNIDDALESVPPTVVIAISMIKVSNIYANKDKFRMISNLIEEQWRVLELTNQLRSLDEITGQGYKISQLYAGTFVVALFLLSLLPLAPVFLDKILPLNETRSRRQLFELYYFTNNEEHFYPLYVHTTWCCTVISVAIVTVDSLYMIITHHACGLFAVCGYQIKRTTEDVDKTRDGIAGQNQSYQRFRECVIAHNRALEFYDIINDITRTTYIFQMGICVVGISITSFQIVMHIHEPTEVLRIGVFLGGQQFHLLFNSLPGQSLVDYSLGVATQTYVSNWYETSLEAQQVLLMIQMRSAVPCTLSAGGLFVLSIESFGIMFKTCMSYCTMLLSVRE